MVVLGYRGWMLVLVKGNGNEFYERLFVVEGYI